MGAIISSASKSSTSTRNGSLPRQVFLDFVDGPDSNRSKVDLEVIKKTPGAAIHKTNTTPSPSPSPLPSLSTSLADKVANLASSALDLVSPSSEDIKNGSSSPLTSNSRGPQPNRSNVLEKQRSLARSQAKMHIPGSMDFEASGSPLGPSATSVAVLSSLPSIKESCQTEGEAMIGSVSKSAGPVPHLPRSFSGATKHSISSGLAVSGSSFRMNIQQSHLQKQQSVRKEMDFIRKTATDLVTVPEGSDINPTSPQQGAGMLLSPLPSPYRQQSSIERALRDIGGSLISPPASSALISGSSVTMPPLSSAPSSTGAAGTKASSLSISSPLLRGRVQAVHLSKQESLRAGRQARRPKSGALWDPTAVRDEYM